MDMFDQKMNGNSKSWNVSYHETNMPELETDNKDVILQFILYKRLKKLKYTYRNILMNHWENAWKLYHN